MGLDALLRKVELSFKLFQLYGLFLGGGVFLGHSGSDSSVSYAADFLFLAMEVQRSLLVCYPRVRFMLSAVFKLRFLNLSDHLVFGSL